MCGVRLTWVFCLEFKTIKASLPGISFKFTPGVSLKPLPLIQTLENFFNAWETPLTAPNKYFFFEIKTFATLRCAEFGLRGFVVYSLWITPFFWGLSMSRLARLNLVFTRLINTITYK